MDKLRQLSVTTRHFGFSVLVEDGQTGHGINLLLEAWRQHCQQYPQSDPELMRELIDNGEMASRVLTVGVVTREG